MWLWFVEWGWLYLMIVMSIILTVQLIVHWKDWDSIRKFGAFAVIVLTFHVWEEWVIPGGFHYIYNISSSPELRDRYPMSEITDMITNFGGAVIWFILTERNKYGRKMHFAVTFFSYFEVVVHFLLAYQSMTAFYEEGIYTGFYAPGLITALCCWLPLGIAGTVWFVRNGIHWKDIAGGLIILAALTVLLVQMPERLLKSENNPYVFDNAGWYEQYTNADGNLISVSE
jgi:hypothetical protein